jgi:HPt (histidine-containing phosphotransfer) domain-containing protein
MTPISKAAEPLYSALSGDPDLAELVEMFVQEMPGRVAALVDQLDGCDWEGLHRTAHRLKGSAGSYGYAPISRCADRLEEAVCTGEPEDRIREAVDALIAVCRRARGRAPT